MKRDPLFLTLLESANTNFSGWDFSFISETGRMKSEPLSWSYGSTAFQLMQRAESMLDMGTGGGEFLSMLQPFPSTIYATEGYAPNVPIAREEIRAFRGYSCRGEVMILLYHFKMVSLI